MRLTSNSRRSLYGFDVIGATGADWYAGTVWLAWDVGREVWCCHFCFVIVLNRRAQGRVKFVYSLGLVACTTN